MCVIKITPLQTAEDMSRRIRNAITAVAHAQYELCSLLTTAEMLTSNWRSGFYQERERTPVVFEPVVSETILQEAREALDRARV